MGLQWDGLKFEHWRAHIYSKILTVFVSRNHFKGSSWNVCLFSEVNLIKFMKGLVEGKLKDPLILLNSE